MESDTESESFVQSFAEKDRSWTVVLKDIFDYCSSKEFFAIY